MTEIQKNVAELKRICDDFSKVAPKCGYDVSCWNVGTPEFRSGGVAKIEFNTAAGIKTNVQIVSMADLGFHITYTNEGQEPKVVKVRKTQNDEVHTNLQPAEITPKLVRKILTKAKKEHTEGLRDAGDGSIEPSGR